jgi:hypothetical protein
LGGAGEAGEHLADHHSAFQSNIKPSSFALSVSYQPATASPQFHLPISTSTARFPSLSLKHAGQSLKLKYKTPDIVLAKGKLPLHKASPVPILAMRLPSSAVGNRQSAHPPSQLKPLPQEASGEVRQLPET